MQILGLEKIWHYLNSSKCGNPKVVAPLFYDRFVMISVCSTNQHYQMTTALPDEFMYSAESRGAI